MKKNLHTLLTKFLVSFLIIGLIPQVSFAASKFPDVSTSNKYAAAIQYLSDVNVINGYPDGQFRPEKYVNRAEFLKIAMLASGIPLDESQPGSFLDVDNDAWYGPYIRKAIKENWIQGYLDKTFRPERSVSKVEALKIIGKIQNWNISNDANTQLFADTPSQEWYAPYVAYALKNSYLEEKTGESFYPGSFLNRGQISQLVYSTVYGLPIPKLPQSQDASISLYDDFLSQKPKPPQGTVAFEMAGRTVFDNVSLDADFPTNFYANELYTFSGSTTGSQKNVTLFLTYKDQLNKNVFIDFPGKVTDGKFEIPVTFREKGKYSVGIIPGDAGTSKIVDISVADFPSATNAATPTPQQATNITLGFKNDATMLSWENNASVKKITVSQGDKEKTYYVRQPRSSIVLPRTDFQDFKPGEASIAIESANTSNNFPLQNPGNWVSSDTKTFQAIQHLTKSIDTQKVFMDAIPESLPNPQKITFTGKGLTMPIQQKADVRKPDGQVETVLLDGKTDDTYFKIPTVPVNNIFSFHYTPTQTGAYQIEINSEDGLAVANVPVYIGNGIPLIPDYQEIYQAETFPDVTINANQYRNTMLMAINQVRKEHGLNAVVRDDSLDTLAQAHADDMATRNYFGHVDPDGKTPQDRRIAMKIPTEVGENLAESPSLLYGFNGLMNSPAHRENILDPKWTRVGLGFTKSKSGSLLTVQEFSTYPLTAADLTNLENQIYNEINKQRKEKGLTSLRKDTKLTEVAKLWSDKLTQMDELAFEAPDGSSIKNILKEEGINRQLSTYLYDTNSTQNFTSYILKESTVLDPKWDLIGLGMSKTDIGDLKFTLIIAE